MVGSVSQGLNVVRAAAAGPGGPGGYIFGDPELPMDAALVRETWRPGRCTRSGSAG